MYTSSGTLFVLCKLPVQTKAVLPFLPDNCLIPSSILCCYFEWRLIPTLFCLHSSAGKKPKGWSSQCLANNSWDSSRFQVRHLELKKEKEVEREHVDRFLLEAMASQFRNPTLWNPWFWQSICPPIFLPNRRRFYFLLTTNFDSMFHTWDDESISLGVLVNILFLKRFSNVYVFLVRRSHKR